jgi:hypothetical protein
LIWWPNVKLELDKRNSERSHEPQRKLTGNGRRRTCHRNAEDPCLYRQLHSWEDQLLPGVERQRVCTHLKLGGRCVTLRGGVSNGGRNPVNQRCCTHSFNGTKSTANASQRGQSRQTSRNLPKVEMGYFWAAPTKSVERDIPSSVSSSEIQYSFFSSSITF